MPALHRRRAPMHEINIVPYVDVMLVLLVIFMVTAPLVTPGVIDLPSVSKASNVKVAPLEVEIRGNGALYLRKGDAKTDPDRPIRLDNLVRLIRDLQAKNPQQPVVIAADKNLRYQAVLDLMDELQKNQVRNIGLLVKPGR
jgi:biopolymer transport protein TolR